MLCWQCGHSLLFLERKISFRATCEKCSAFLHCCKNCKYYSIGRPNDCSVPRTERISDRQANNFCEEFSPLDKPPHPIKQDRAKFDDLFKS